ncbi:MAG: HAMP domain-containing sensor histidine kinase [Bacteroidota bacterium]
MRLIRKHIFLLLCLIFMAFSSLYLYFGVSDPSPSDDIAKIQRCISEKTEKCQININSIIKKLDSDTSLPSLQNNEFSSLQNSDGISFYLFQNLVLKSWSSNAVHIDRFFLNLPADSAIAQFKNGSYLPIYKKHGNFIVLALILIKHEYRYQNEYLVNGWNPDFGIHDSYKLSFSPGTNNVIYKNRFLFSISLQNSNADNGFGGFIPVIFFILSCIFFISYLHKLSHLAYHRFRSVIVPIAFIAIILGLRYASLYFKVPWFIYDLELFGPLRFSSSFLFPSFGDLLVNIVLIFYLSVYFSEHFLFSFRNHKLPKILVHSIFSVCVFLIFFLGLLCLRSISLIILNSDISFNVYYFFDLNILSYLSFALFSLVFFSFFFITSTLVSQLFLLYKKSGYFILHFFIAILLFCLFFFENSKLFYISLFLSGMLYLALVLIRNYRLRISSFYSILFIVILFSVCSTYLLNHETSLKEKERRKALALTLSEDQDPVAEYIFSEIERDIEKDSTLRNLIASRFFNEEKINDHLIKKYFSGYWSKYDIQITICRPQDSLIVKPGNIQLSCFSFFEDKMSFGESTISCNLYSLNKGGGRKSYIARLSMAGDPNPLVSNTSFFLEMDSKFVPKGIGYPELLLDKKVSGNVDISDYSYARYVNGSLTSQYGKYLYNIVPNLWQSGIAEFAFRDHDDYNHLVYQVDKETTLVLSLKNKSFLDIITPFSYLLTIYSFIVLVYILLRNIRQFFARKPGNFKTRVQISMISIVVISLTVLGFSSVYYIMNIFDNKNNESIKEKTHSVLTEVENKAAGVNDITDLSYDYWNEILIKFSNVFFSDINVYDRKGYLIASSRSKIFDEGLTGENMNPEAFCELILNKRTLFIHKEEVGRLSYLSAYTPIRNYKNELIGYLNLPYFSKQNEMKKELSTFLVALINIYVLLFGLAVVASLFISGFVTKPLLLIREKMAKLKLGRKNEAIEWKSNDEIGMLINEYNRMIKELTKSAELLAKSERESAWQEMAKQVAHEIKNPLTPMKLSVQYLERAWKDNAPNFDDRLKKFTETIIEQIDTLSAIASAFSDFAKLPTANMEKIELLDFIGHTVDLYKDFENCDITFSTTITSPCHILADKNQLLRVFTNLIKNGMQAIPDERTGLIKISLHQRYNRFHIRIQDNGSGIPESAKQQIFSPNFTTKTGGMGLGLAMVRNIVESMNGKISFESTENVGTIFTVTLPKQA